MVIVRIWELDDRRNRTLRSEARFEGFGSVALWLAEFAEHRAGLVYEIEQYDGTPGFDDPDGL